MTQETVNGIKQAHHNGKADVWTLTSDHAAVEIWSLGAAIHNLELRHEDGKRVKPLAEADWLTDADWQGPIGGGPHLSCLGGEWPCVPFGSVSADPDHHGFCSNNHWQLEDRSANFAKLSITYPDTHPVKRLTRTVRLRQDQPTIELSLGIEVKSACRLPIGLHPIFKLPIVNNRLAIREAADTSATAAPASLAPPNSILAANQQVDITQVPMDDCHELVQIWHTDGCMTMAYPDENATIQMTWDKDLLPHCLLWIANPADFGRDTPSLFRGIGIEPIHSFFDRNDLEREKSEHPLDLPETGIDLVPDQTFEVSYQISSV